MVRVEQIMGTAISFTVPGEAPPGTALDAAVDLLRAADARFSTYRDDSEVCRLNRGELREGEVSAELAEVLGLCEEVRLASGGAFDIRGHRQGGIDPSGLVKGWAVQRAAEQLRAAGVGDVCVNAGGDVAAVGESAPGRPWHIGIRHPDHAESVAAVFAVTDLGVATSGLYERGDHVIDPRTGRAPRELRSVTVIGPSLTYADAYATAALVMGREGVAWVASIPGYGAFAITAGERTLRSANLDGLVVT